jgi:hypothetical protein
MDILTKIKTMEKRIVVKVDVSKLTQVGQMGKNTQG